MHLTITGEVKAQSRPRGAIIKNRIVFYEVKETKAYKDLIEKEFRKKYPQHKRIEEQINCYIKIYKAVPKSFSKKKTQEALSGESRPTSKPDVDNYGKLVLDALNGVAYKDDSQIVSLVIEKHYATEDRLEVTIERLGERKMGNDITTEETD